MMRAELFNQFRELIYGACGIVLSPEKQPLLEYRLSKRLRVLNCASDEEYLSLLRRDSTGQELEELINVVSTNTTHFFREENHFEILKTFLDSHRASGARRLRIWCAASSSGEEPYTLAMTTVEALGSAPIDTKILATDISTTVLRRAVEGVYSDTQIEKVPIALKRKYFVPVGPAEARMFEVRSALKKLIVFKRFNLTTFPYPLKGKLDVIFCRNVMIYFDHPIRQRIVEQFERLLRPGGMLVVSHSENLLGLEHSMIRRDNSVYLKES